MALNRKILCLDFDGVIHAYTSGWQGAHVCADGPTSGAMEFICHALDLFEVHIHSSRSKSLRGRKAMKDWMLRRLSEHFGAERGKIIFEAIKWPWFKPSAFVTLDDRAITFTGEWPDYGYLSNFKPWNK